MSKAKNAEEYIAQQQAALAANPDCGTTHYNLAVALLGQKNYDEAEEQLHQAIDCSPNLAEAYVQLGGTPFAARRSGRLSRFQQEGGSGQSRFCGGIRQYRFRAAAARQRG